MTTSKDAGVDAVSRLPMAVIGAGSWGTALAVHLARTGHATTLWGVAPPSMADLARDRVNRQYLPEAPFPDGLAVAFSLEEALRDANDLLVAVPSHAFRACLNQVRPLLRPGMRVAWATKGFELETGKLPHQVANEVLGADLPKAVLSGPTFAREVGLGLPTAIVQEGGYNVDVIGTLLERFLGAWGR